jgi:hypothetical protein
MYLPSESESEEAPELTQKKTLVKNVRHFLNRTWKIKVASVSQLKALMKYEVEKLQEELETDSVPKFFYHKQPGEDPYMIYRGLASEMPPATPKKVDLPPNTSRDPNKQGLKLDDTAIYYFRGDYPLFIPFYGEEVSAIDRTGFVDPITQTPFPIGSYIVQFTNGTQETFMTKTSLIKYWNRPSPLDTPEDRARFFAEKIKNPATSTPFHDFYAKFVKVVQITAAQIVELQERKHAERAQFVGRAGDTVGNVGKKVGSVALGATGLVTRAIGVAPRGVGLAADLTKAAANKTGLTNVAAAADYASLVAHGIGKGIDTLGKTAYDTARGNQEKEPVKEKPKGWFESIFY